MSGFSISICLSFHPAQLFLVHESLSIVGFVNIKTHPICPSRVTQIIQQSESSYSPTPDQITKLQ